MAGLLVSEHPLALCLDIDLLRRSLGRWDEHPQESGLLARDLAVAAARAHLMSGHAVVVAQFLGRLAFVGRLESLAREVGAPSCGYAKRSLAFCSPDKPGCGQYTSRGRRIRASPSVASATSRGQRRSRYPYLSAGRARK